MEDISAKMISSATTTATAANSWAFKIGTLLVIASVGLEAVFVIQLLKHHISPGSRTTHNSERPKSPTKAKGFFDAQLNLSRLCRDYFLKIR